MTNKFAHICVDLETLSTRNNAVIVTIAAVKFNFGSDDMESFSVNIDPRDSKSYGLDIAADTMEWWKSQPKEAVKAWQHSRISLIEGLDAFTKFCGDSNSLLFYSVYPVFTFPKLEASYSVVDRPTPWKYYNIRDTNTIYWLTQSDHKKPVVNDALSKCYSQIKNLKMSLGVV